MEEEKIGVITNREIVGSSPMGDIIGVIPIGGYSEKIRGRHPLLITYMRDELDITGLSSKDKIKLYDYFHPGERSKLIEEIKELDNYGNK